MYGRHEAGGMRLLCPVNGCAETVFEKLPLKLCPDCRGSRVSKTATLPPHTLAHGRKHGTALLVEPMENQPRMVSVPNGKRKNDHWQFHCVGKKSGRPYKVTSDSMSYIVKRFAPHRPGDVVEIELPETNTVLLGRPLTVQETIYATVLTVEAKRVADVTPDELAATGFLYGTVTDRGQCGCFECYGKWWKEAHPHHGFESYAWLTMLELEKP